MTILQSNTKTRHQAIFNRFNELVEECRKNGKYQKLYLSNFYVQIGEEMGYSDNYVCRIVCKLQRERHDRQK